MGEKDFNLTRRKFIAASSAAVAAPLVMGMTGKVPEARAEERKGFFVNDDCISCSRCKNVCPQGAIAFDGDKFAIDTHKCVQCRTCMGVCNMAAIIDPNEGAPVHKPHDILNRDCDFLVVGGGTSGLVAAAIAGELSGKKVIVLEKAKKPGGSGLYAAGIRMFSTKWQRDAGVPDQMDDYIRSAMNITRWQLNPKLVANSFQALPAFFDWFCTWGKAEEIFTLGDSRYSKARKSIDLIDFDQRTTPVMKRLIDRCAAMGVEILTEHTASEYIMGDRGEITAVKAKDPGGTTVFNCKYCLVATGNVINCGPLMQRCVPEYAQALRRRGGHRLPSNTGDGVLMAEAAGIPIEYDRVCVTYTTINQAPGSEMPMDQEGRGEALFINLHGKRWVNETFAAGDFNWILLEQPKNTFFSVVDSEVLTMDPLPRADVSVDGNRGGRNVEAGVPDPYAEETGSSDPFGGMAGPMFGSAGGTGGGMQGMPGGKTNIEDLKKLASLPGRHVSIADTLEELADKMGVDRKTFAATVKRYNELCEKGRDDDFYKPAKYMLPVKTAPFYAFNYILGMDGAVGGLAIDENMQVVGKGGPVGGLYAAGDTTGGRFINHGGDRIEIINDFSWAIASGYLAGENIGKRLKKS